MVHAPSPSPSPSPPPATKDKTQTSRHQLETITRSMLEAINTRDFNPSSPSWSSTVSSFTVEVAFTSSPQSYTFADWLTELNLMTTRSPDLRIHVLSIDSSLDDATHGHTFADLEWHGMPPGLVRPSYAIYDFVRVQGRWVCVKHRALPGIAAGSRTVVMAR